MAFAIAGAIVYQVTAPPPAPGERTFSPGQILENIRRGIRGNRAAAESVNAVTIPVDRAITELRLGALKGSAREITIVGEDRADLAAEVKVHSNAYDEAEAQRTAKGTVFKAERAGTRLVGLIDFPREGSQTAALTLHVPSRLRVQIETTRSRAEITNVAGVDIQSGRGETEISQVSGMVAGNYRGGELRITRAGSLKLSVVGTDMRLEQIGGQISLNIRAGSLKAAELGGPIDIDSNGVDIELEKLDKATGMVRVNASAGSVSLKGLRTDARIDARNSDVDAVIERAAPVAIYSEGGSPVDITPPPGGYQLDAVASDGNVIVSDGTVPVTANGLEHRASGPVKGGGPAITIRAAHANITIRTREAAEGSGANGVKR